MPEYKETLTRAALIQSHHMPYEQLKSSSCKLNRSVCKAVAVQTLQVDRLTEYELEIALPSGLWSKLSVKLWAEVGWLKCQCSTPAVQLQEQG